MKRLILVPILLNLATPVALSCDAPNADAGLFLDELTILTKWRGVEYDLVAQQIRTAAEEETDPVRRHKLWTEYHNYMTVLRVPKRSNRK